MSQAHNLHVSPVGNDRWSGRFDAPRDGDGPLRTLVGARDRVRQLKRDGKLSGPVTVWFAEGVYPIGETVIFTPEDTYPVTYAAPPGVTAIMDGGRVVDGFQPDTLNGRPVWSVRVPEVLARKNYLSFFVNGVRRPRATWPKLAGPEAPQWLRIKDVPGCDLKTAGPFRATDAFVVDPADFVARDNLSDVEVVVMHYWVEERMPVATFEPDSGLIRSSLTSRHTLNDDFGPKWARYYLDNVKEALTEPGEWYLDRTTATLYYVPMSGETPESVTCVLPRLDQLVRMQGDLEHDRPVQFLRFENLRFSYTDATRITGGGFRRQHVTQKASGPQSAIWYGGAIGMTCCQNCAIEGCTVNAVGWYGIDLGEGCVANRIVGNHLHDIGAGGVKIHGTDAEGPRHARSGNNTISDNTIERFGRVFHAGAGVIAMDGYGNRIIHNLIRDGYYTGVSVGWVWGYAESVSRDNRIEFNHIHQIGQGWLSDMGGIYTLGVQPGTTIRNNLIHDIHAHGYGGWGIYPDEGSSHIVIENNVVHDCKTNCFNQHYGRENIVRNNIFADGGRAIASLGRREPWNSFTFQRNVCITNGTPLWIGGYGSKLEAGDFIADDNLLHARKGVVHVQPSEQKADPIDLEQWRNRGYDRRSEIADPGLIDLARGVYAVAPGSAADRIGFRSVDLTTVGPRPQDQRGNV